MKISQKYSHLNGEEFLIVHHPELYREIEEVISAIDANGLKSKISKEKTKKGDYLFSPRLLNSEFDHFFSARDWHESRYHYYVTLNRELMEQSILLPHEDQRDFLVKNGEVDPIKSYNQTDFVKDKVAVEVQFGRYSFVAYDLFVKHMLFYSGGVINLGVEIFPPRKMQTEMSSGIAYFEEEVYKVMRQGRNHPAVPLLILGVEP